MRKLRKLLWILSVGIFLMGLVYHATGQADRPGARNVLAQLIGSK